MQVRWWLGLGTGPCTLEYHNAAFIQSTVQDLTGKVCSAGCSGLFSEQCNSNGTRLQRRASIPPLFAPNEHQSKAHSYSNTEHQVYTRKAMQLDATYFWTGKYFPCHCLVGANILQRKSKQEKTACRKESQACNQWLGWLSGQDDIPAAAWSSSPNCQTLMFVNCRPTFSGGLPQQRLWWNSCQPDMQHKSVSEWSQPDTNRYSQMKGPFVVKSLQWRLEGFYRQTVALNHVSK